MLALALLVSFGCGGDDTVQPTGGDSPCNPLEGEPVPLEIGEVVAVGRALDGKLYAIDRPRGSEDLRVLESEGEMLFARGVAGGSMSDNGVVEVTHLTVESASFGYTLILEVDEDGEMRMARVMGQTTDQRSVAELSPSERLEVVDPEVLSELTPAGIPTQIVILYVARVSTGELLAVFGPSDGPDNDFAGIRVFYGDEREQRERGQVEIDRLEDQETTRMTFDLDGELAVAIFPALDEETGEIPPASLEIGGGDPLVLERIEEGEGELRSAEFLCL